MTNYNERLDEILANLVNQVAANEQRLLNGNATREETIGSDSNATMRAKQAITSLTKELVAEAKPAELDDILKPLRDFGEDNAHGMTWEYSTDIEDDIKNDTATVNGLATEAKQAILELIRTEKLKLLAEVRERVVGSLEPHTENGLLPDRVDRRNQLRTEQLDVLTKLEAEL